jgi:hypothetical protein
VRVRIRRDPDGVVHSGPSCSRRVAVTAAVKTCALFGEVLRVAQLAAYLGSVGVSWLICAVVELSSRTSRQSSMIRSPLRPQDLLPA